MRVRLLLAALLLGASGAQARDVVLTATAIHTPENDAAGVIDVAVSVMNVSSPGLTVQPIAIEYYAYRRAGGNPAVSVRAPGWACGADPSWPNRCVLAGGLLPGTTARLMIHIQFASLLARGHAQVYGRWESPSTPHMSFDNMYVDVPLLLDRVFTVTTTADDGPGSLRRAIGDLNADPECARQPCRIAFAIPPGGREWQTIALRSALPVIHAEDLAIDGTSQIDFAGGTNRKGPQVELRGDALAAGNGIEVRGALLDIRGLAVGGFPEDGVSFTPPGNLDSGSGVLTAIGNHLGLDPSGRLAVPNGKRGISVESGYLLEGMIRDNRIGGNLRAGLSLEARLSSWGSQVPRSIEIAGNDLVDNEAGIYFGPLTTGEFVRDNRIVGNRDFGIAVARRAFGIRMGPNVIWRNGRGIDIGLDGPTPGVAGDDAVVQVATLLSASYDPTAKATTIRGRGLPTNKGSTAYSYSYSYALYANDSDGPHGQQFLGNALPAGDGTFTLTVGADLRGKFVTSLTARVLYFDGAQIYDTSELSEPLAVPGRRRPSDTYARPPPR